MLSCLYLYLYERPLSRVVTLLARRHKVTPLDLFRSSRDSFLHLKYNAHFNFV
jgi:hypothetical protein